MRLERFYNTTRPTVKKKAPWAKAIVCVDGVYLAYESKQEAEEQHGAMTDLSRPSSTRQELWDIRKKPFGDDPPPDWHMDVPVETLHLG